jgi:Fe2+ transport system protein FeoA
LYQESFVLTAHTSDLDQAPTASIPLTQLSRGQRGRVQINGSTEEIKMLRAMGLRPNASVTMCRLGEPCIVSLSGACGGGCRIGLAKEIAGRVMVSIDIEDQK